MKLRHKSFSPLYLPTVVLLITSLWSLTFTAAARRKQNDDSILEIMDHHEIGKLLLQQQQQQQRRLHPTSANGMHLRDPESNRNPTNDKRRYYLQNDLVDTFAEVSLTAAESDRSTESYGKKTRHTDRAGSYSDLAITADEDDELPKTSMEEIFMPFNESLNAESPIPADMHTMHGSKLLKSSKNALFITRKEYLKKDWCKTEPLIQRIREPGCLTRTFVNRFCYGQCNSFYIPKSPKRRRSFASSRSTTAPGQTHFEDEDLTAAAFQSCGFCKPKKYTWITVTLRCPSLVPQLRKKRIQKIKQCKCMAEPVH